MTDVAIKLTENGFDISLDGYDLERDDGLDTAVLLSLFCDKRATAEELPAELPAEDLRGWWGDYAPEVEGDKFGSHLWLLAREKQTTGTLSRAKQYAEASLQWMLDDRVAERVQVRTSYPRQGWMAIEIDIYRPGGKLARYRYDYEWAAQAAKRAA